MAPKKVLMAASGDLRQSANETCWPAQEAMEKNVAAAVAAFGVEVVRAHPYDPARKHGFIASQKEGLEIFAKVDPDTPIIIAEAVWQYSYHVLPGLLSHRAPILTIANWSGEWPGLVGMLNLNGSLTKADKPYSTLWSETFTDEPFKKKLHQWLNKGRIDHDLSHVHAFDPARRPRGRRRSSEDRRRSAPRQGDHGHLRRRLHGDVQRDHPRRAAVPARRLQGAPVAVGPIRGLARDPRRRGEGRLRWLVKAGFTFHFGKDPATELTLDQVI